MMGSPAEAMKPKTGDLADLPKKLFVKLGILPFLLVIAIIVFAAMSDNFLTVRNLTNVLRQSVYLTIVAMGQMFALLTGGFDLSVGTVVALSSVVGAMVMAGTYAAMPDVVWLAIVLGCLAGIVAGGLVGVCNGVGVAFFNVSPFMMSLGMTSVGFGAALFLTGGVPVYGMPQTFGDVFGFGSLLGIHTPIYGALIIAVVLHVVLYRTPFGRHFYAVGGNIKAARLSGVNTRATLFWTYVISAGMAAVAGMLLAARLDTGEANIGTSMPLQSIAACVIAGVSLRGGVGRLENVILGALFIGLVENGMNLARIESYLQTVVLGLLLIIAVIADQLRLKYVASLKD
ncbi:monosaccharide ABC transporter membrane protein (CUT2 family) [Breoghania corrubedonensis]|uniref:Autoinducer 2 import system permease protein LsrD n=1 Tax=Breoghania corrubedonensis TaxID=665038 RepID=A0A2T5VGJ1_9HYPH|nr:ABC transporter permease [Breoghania corrubedonensis]PTW62865.1 monosaccharide ABC transporter membrane protein (CUT2 family) [Breoghania corrubedonensis]